MLGMYNNRGSQEFSYVLNVSGLKTTAVLKILFEHAQVLNSPKDSHDVFLSEEEAREIVENRESRIPEEIRAISDYGRRFIQGALPFFGKVTTKNGVQKKLSVTYCERVLDCRNYIRNNGQDSFERVKRDIARLNGAQLKK